MEMEKPPYYPPLESRRGLDTEKSTHEEEDTGDRPGDNAGDNNAGDRAKDKPKSPAEPATPVKSKDNAASEKKGTGVAENEHMQYESGTG